MNSPRKPSLLVILVRAERQQWFVAGVDSDAGVMPLVRSEPGNLDEYEGKSPDEQLSFMRHRLSGAMQRGCDRLFGRDRKASQIVMGFDGPMPESSPGLLEELAEHLHTWMTRPPISVYRCETPDTLSHFDQWVGLVGPLEGPDLEVMRLAVPKLTGRLDENEWEVIPKPPAG